MSESTPGAPSIDAILDKSFTPEQVVQIVGRLEWWYDAFQINEKDPEKRKERKAMIGRVATHLEGDNLTLRGFQGVFEGAIDALAHYDGVSKMADRVFIIGVLDVLELEENVKNVVFERFWDKIVKDIEGDVAKQWSGDRKI